MSTCGINGIGDVKYMSETHVIRAGVQLTELNAQIYRSCESFLNNEHCFNIIECTS